MHFGFALELSDIDLWNIDLLDTHLDLLDTDIPSKYFACLHNVFKTSSRHVFKTSSRHVFKTSSRRLQRNNFSSSKTSSRRSLSSRLGRRKIITLKTCWRRLQNMFAGIFPVTSVKKFIYNVTGLAIFHLSEAATGGVLLEKVFLEIL